jgi:alpha-glucosidase (family GH31 glycosyl hydrolase)
MGPVRQYVDEPVEGTLTLHVFPGADGASSVYEDDGRSFEYRKGQFMRLEDRWDDGARRLRLSFAAGSKMFPPAPRTFEVAIAGSKERKTVTFNGKPVEVR